MNHTLIKDFNEIGNELQNKNIRKTILSIQQNPEISVTVHGFKGSGVQGCILVRGVHF